MLRASFAVLVGAAAGLEVVGEAGDGPQAGRLPAKLHARDRAQLVIAAYEGGLVTVG